MKSFSGLFILLFFLSACSTTPVGKQRDLGHMISGDEDSAGGVERILKDVSPDKGIHPSGPSLAESSLVEKIKTDERKTFSIPHSSKLSGLDPESLPSSGRGFHSAGVLGPPEYYQEYSASELVGQNYGQHSYAVGISYILDSYNYDDSRGVFAKTFENSSDSAKNGTLMVNWNSHFLKTSYLEPFWLINVGLGHNMGKGQFIDGQEAEATFTLWMLPLDLGLGLDVSLSRFLKVGASGGPSAMGLIQNRSDYDSTEGKNTRRQGSLGYFYEAHAKLNLSMIFPKSGRSLFLSQDVTSYYLTLKLRSHEFNGFLDDDFEISGQSIGLGLNFEFL